MKKIFLLLMFLTFAQNFAQYNDVLYENLSIEEGISQVTVNSITQDYLGFLWFATDDGLNKYDGYNFTIYNYNPADSNSFQSNEIKVVYEDSHKNLWAGTDGGGLYKYLRDEDHFVRIDNDYKKNKKLGNKNITCLYEYSGSLWVGTQNGLNKFDHKTNEFINIGENIKDENSFQNIFISSICGDNNGNLWLATQSGLIKYNFVEEEITKYKHNPNNKNSLNENSIKSICYSSNNILWIATETSGINSFNPITNNFASYKSISGNSNSLSSNTTFSIIEDNRKNILVSTLTGLDIYDPHTDKFRKLIENYNEKSRGGFARIIYQDNENIFWAGTDNAGADKIVFTKNYFHNYLSTDEKSKQLSIVPIFEDSDKTLWIGTFGFGLYVKENENDLPVKFKYNQTIGNYLLSLCEDNNKNIWIGTRHKGIFLFNKKTSELINYSTKNTNLTSDFISVIYKDKRNDIWIGTYGGGVYKYNKTENDFISFNPANANLTKMNIASIIEDRNWNIWIGTENNGVYKYNLSSEKIINYKKNEAVNTLSHNEINSIIEGKDGIIWIGTYTGGLNKFDPETNTFKFYTTENGLINNSVYGVLEDLNGSLWLSTNKGLSKFNPSTETFINFYQKDEIKSKEFNQGSYFKSRNDYLYFGGTNGLVTFHPDSIKNEKINYRIVLTDFRIANKSVKSGLSAPLKKHISIAKEINLSYKDYVIEFEFAVLNYLTQNRIKYAYKMEDFDFDWIITGSQKRFASYTNLEPGSYIFRVRVFNENGILSNEEASINIFISPPFWQTWWFYILLFLTITSILYAIYKYRINQILQLERIRVGIASDLHDDIGATLTKLALKADMIQQGIDTENKTTGLKRISEMSRQAVSTMSDIVWSIDSRNDTFESMINKMKDFSFGILTDKEIKVEFNATGFDKSEKAPIEFRQNLYLIFKEAINNIAKHSDANRVKIDFTNNDKEFELIISDNGKNFKEKEIQVGHGLKNMKMRAEKINARIQYKNENGFSIYIAG